MEWLVLVSNKLSTEPSLALVGQASGEIYHLPVQYVYYIGSECGMEYIAL